MLDINQVLKKNEALIQRFVDLSLCKDDVYDSRHKWFYTLISIDKVKSLSPFLLADDIRSEIQLHLISRAKNYKQTEFEFSNYIKKSIGWHIKDYLLSIERQYVRDTTYYKSLKFNIQTEHNDSLDLDLNWVLTDSKLTLNQYHKYLLYLYCNKCYTIEQIETIVYQEKTTLRKQFNSIKKTLRDLYGKN